MQSTPLSSSETHCFLCSLDSKPCILSHLTGNLLSFHERAQGTQIFPLLILETNTLPVRVYLDPLYHRSLLKELQWRAELAPLPPLTIHIYHLPAQIPTPPTADYLAYQANNHTLVVLEPDTLLNITDLNDTEYCARQYILKRYLPSTSSISMIRGNAVHYCFKELLKTPTDDPRSPLQILKEQLEVALRMFSLDLALLNIDPQMLREEVIPHLESLANWYLKEHATLWEQTNEQKSQQVRAETFLLAPELGLRGRLDLFWEQNDRQRLLELKTGGQSGSLPRQEHRWQVYGYHAQLAIRRHPRMRRALGTLLYSGTPGLAQDFVIPSTIRDIQRVMERRNLLILSKRTALPVMPPNERKCSKCSLRQECSTLSQLKNWTAPLLTNYATTEEEQSLHQTTLPLKPTSEDTSFFRHYEHLLHLEGLAEEAQQATLWHTSVEERLSRGSAISGLAMQSPPTSERDGWLFQFSCQNGSELREGDEILLSNGDPIKGEVVTGSIISISSEIVRVWTREQINDPQLIDRYANDMVHVRTLQNLVRWLHTPHHLRQLVYGLIYPHFRSTSVVVRSDFNEEQRLAVQRSLEMQDYLLIQGPPGTGKTSVIAEIVHQLVLSGQRVLLAAFTNQAVDNMLKRLLREGFTDFIRLGQERSVDKTIHPHLLQVQMQTSSQPAGETARQLLTGMPVIASTTASWSSDRYTVVAGEKTTFDVAIIDEASQLTVPALLGAIRLSKRFILVGDEQQLPPLVLNPEANQAGLGKSLFQQLKETDTDHLALHPKSISACVSLRTQYRMNKWISYFASTVFYEQRLQPHPSIAQRFLELQTPLGEISAALHQALEPRRPVVFLDVPGTSNQRKQRPQEAKAIRELIAQLFACGILPQDIGVIAPYRAQVAQIRRHLLSDAPDIGWTALTSDSLLSVDTVDRFQGGERPIIILSLATDQEPDTQSPLREFLTNPNRLNVALTRAQRKLIVVGKAEAIEQLPILRRFLAYTRSMNTMLNYPLPVGGSPDHA